jgi:hypothetical protein
MSHDAHAAAVVLPRGVARAAHAGPHAPTWAIVVGIGLGVLVAVFCLTLALIRDRPPPGREGDDNHGSGPGGGGPRRPGPDGGDAPGGAPEWWADFERQFAAYVSERKASVR